MNIFKGILFFLSLFVSPFLFAQSGQLKGIVVDEQNVPVEFANVILFQLPDSVKVLSDVTDVQGKFLFVKVPYGEYYLYTAQFGLQSLYSQKIVVSNPSTLNFEFQLKPAVVEGKEVTILAQRSLVRVEEGKIIVDVQNSLGNSGQSVVDVLRKSPGIAVDQDGKIQLKGKDGVQVMLDDKVMYLSPEQLGNLLKSIPAELIKEIEIISSPSAKYDAAGNGGIINIRLKKGAYEGLNGTANASYGSGIYHKANVGTNISYKKNKLSLNAGYQFNHKTNLSDLYDDRMNKDPSAIGKRIYTSTYYKIPARTHNLTVNGQYQLSEKTNLSFDFSDSYSKYTWDGTANTQLFNQENSVKNIYQSRDIGSENYLNAYSSIGFKHRADTNGTIFSGYASLNLNRLDEDKDQNIQYYDSISTNLNTPFIFLYSNKNNTIQHNAQLDFEKNIFNKIKFETGIKYVSLDDDKPVKVDIIDNGVYQNANNHFQYKENVYAAYTMFSKTLGKWSLQGGLRLERTQVTGELSLIDSTFKRDYTNLFPSGNITYKHSDNTSYTFLYSRRITRPTADQLNPVLNINDPFSAWGGDPYLLPQFANNAEITQSLFNGVFLTTLNYTYITNPIVWTYKLDKASNKFISGQRNLSYQESYGLSFVFNKALTKWWTTNNSFLLNNNIFLGNTDFGSIKNQSYSWGLKLSQSLNLPKKFKLELSGLYDSPSAYAFSYAYDRWQANFALQRVFHKEKINIKLAYNDMFRTFRYAGTNVMGTTSQISSYRWDNRTLILSVTYKFGNQLMNAN